ncbi:MAG: flagellar motor protein MotB [Acidobacteria bacterium]|nr:flagellar motor protein MotB [Acidobacteriota bacterium]
MPDPKTQPIIIIKKKASHGGHHGGAWKVAYADFVTAMMALFIVLWLMNSNKEIQEAVGGYFRDPTGTGAAAGAALAGPAPEVHVDRDDMGKLKDIITDQLQNLAQAEKLKDQVQMVVGREGLRVELIETASGMFFDSGSALPNTAGSDLLIMLAQELGKLPNRVLIEGHTDSKPFTSRLQYTNWELSADRANGARRIMEASGLRPNQVSQVRGFADQHLRNAADPLDPANRRISVIVLNQQDKTGEEEESKPPPPQSPPH